MRNIFKIEVKNDWIVKGRQFEGVRKIQNISSNFNLTSNETYEEILLLDMTKSVFGLPPNFDALEAIAKRALLPITFGGGIRTLSDALKAFDLGASRIYLNTILFDNIDVIDKIQSIVGAQAITVGCEYRLVNDKRVCFSQRGNEPSNLSVKERAIQLSKLGIGEVICTSIDRDGLGIGFDYGIDNDISEIPVPVILCGGGRDTDKMNIHSNCTYQGICFSSIYLDTL